MPGAGDSNDARAYLLPNGSSHNAPQQLQQWALTAHAARAALRHSKQAATSCIVPLLLFFYIVLVTLFYILFFISFFLLIMHTT